MITEYIFFSPSEDTSFKNPPAHSDLASLFFFFLPMRLVFWCLSWHLRGCEVKMSQACHTIKGNKKKNVHCNPRFGDKMSMYCGALCSLDAAAELLTAPSAEVEITPAGSAGSSNISSRFHPVLCDSLQHMNAAVALLYLAGVSGVHRLDHIQSSSVLFRCPSKP